MCCSAKLRSRPCGHAGYESSSAGMCQPARCDVSQSCTVVVCVFFFSSRRRHTRFDCDWSSDVCSSDLLPLREELQFIDDYLDIEVARFGKDNLDIVKHIDAAALEAFVPSMLLQPMVENCLKHGLATKLGGGKIELRTTSRDGRLRIEIEDNGVGISERSEESSVGKECRSRWSPD